MCSLQAGAEHDDDDDDGDDGGGVGDGGDGANSQQVSLSLKRRGNNPRHHLHVSYLPDFQLNTPQ